MAGLSRQEAERAKALDNQRGVLRGYLRQVKEGKKFQIVIPDESDSSGSAAEPQLMLKMMALADETRALAEAEAEIHERIQKIEAKMRGLGVSPD